MERNWRPVRHSLCAGRALKARTPPSEKLRQIRRIDDVVTVEISGTASRRIQPASDNA